MSESDIYMCQILLFVVIMIIIIYLLFIIYTVYKYLFILLIHIFNRNYFVELFVLLYFAQIIFNDISIVKWLASLPRVR